MDSTRLPKLTFYPGFPPPPLRPKSGTFLPAFYSIRYMVNSELTSLGWDLLPVVNGNNIV